MNKKDYNILFKKCGDECSKALEDQRKQIVEKEVQTTKDAILQSKQGWIEQGKKEARKQIVDEIEGMEKDGVASFGTESKGWFERRENENRIYNQALNDVLECLTNNSK